MLRSLDKRIMTFLKEHPDELPWPYGCDPEKLSKEAKAVWDGLTKIERLSISKHCPFRLQAYWATYRLVNQEGIRPPLLKEICGVDRATIYRRLKRARVL